MIEVESIDERSRRVTQRLQEQMEELHNMKMRFSGMVHASADSFIDPDGSDESFAAADGYGMSASPQQQKVKAVIDPLHQQELKAIMDPCARSKCVNDTPLIVDERILPVHERARLGPAAFAIDSGFLSPENVEPLRTCEHCGRRFNPVSWEKHQAVCRKVFQKVQNPGTSRHNDATPLQRRCGSPRRSSPNPRTPQRPPSNSTTQGSRAGSAGLGATKPCPHCGRIFSLRGAYSTHVNICQSVFPSRDTRQRPRSPPRASPRTRGKEMDSKSMFGPTTPRASSPSGPSRVHAQSLRHTPPGNASTARLASPPRTSRSLSPSRSCPELERHKAAKDICGQTHSASTSAAAPTAPPCRLTRARSVKELCEERAARLDRARLGLKMSSHGLAPNLGDAAALFCSTTEIFSGRSCPSFPESSNPNQEFAAHLATLDSETLLSLANQVASEREFSLFFPEHMQDLAAGLWRRFSEFQDVQEKLQTVRGQSRRCN